MARAASTEEEVKSIAALLLFLLAAAAGGGGLLAAWAAAAEAEALSMACSKSSSKAAAWSCVGCGVVVVWLSRVCAMTSRVQYCYSQRERWTISKKMDQNREIGAT